MILIPTEFERQIIGPSLAAVADRKATDGQVASIQQRPIELCGFGPVAAAALTTRLITEFKPSSVVLVGIAGTYDDAATVGQAFVFDSVSCYGIGVGSGTEFQPAAQLGWPQVDTPRISDSIACESNGDRPRQLLTVCAAAAVADDVLQRRRIFPDAVAEDMEGFGVAMACSLADIPLTIVRGISNVAADRDKSRWQIRSALDAAAKLTVQLLTND